MKDSLGDRMKEQYENRTRYMLPRRTYTIIRVDGKAFHNYTRNMERPYDTKFMKCMDEAAVCLCEELQGSQFSYVQSDEISVLLTDFAKPETSAAFDGNLQKLCSVAASMVTCGFNAAAGLYEFSPTAVFDARVFTIPDPVEVENYFIWRQKDAERNSVQMLAQHYASHKQLFGKSIPEQQDIIHAAGDNWNNHPAGFKRGRVVIYAENVVEGCRPGWKIEEPPIFTQDRAWLSSKVPRQWAEDGQKAMPVA